LQLPKSLDRSFPTVYSEVSRSEIALLDPSWYIDKLLTVRQDGGVITVTKLFELQSRK